jgi:UDP-2,3-diacylglucosamine hydrolase
MFFKPVPGSVGDEFFFHYREFLHLFGIKCENLIELPKREPADEYPLQQHFQLPVVHPLDEFMKEQPFQIIVKAGNHQKLVFLLFDVLPEGVIVVIGRDGEYLSRVAIKEEDDFRIGVLKAVQEVVPDYFHITHYGHGSYPRYIRVYLYPVFRYSAVMRSIFIADAHLRNPGDENYGKLLRFLSGLRGNTDTLYILGDLFEFWIGYRTTPFVQYLPILEELRLLADGGTAIVYFEGNHDFHMGPFFRETLKAEVHKGPAIIDLEGKRVYLCHGDQVNRADTGYHLLRFLLHNPLTCAIVPIFPAGLAVRIADGMGRASRQGHRQREVKWDYSAILREFAAARFREGCDTVISGHFHVPLLETSGEHGERTLLSLGDWITHFTYGEWLDGELFLKRFE